MIKLATGIRREQIKEAVLEIVYREGISKFTTKRLAAKIGISEAAIFKHYASKQEIVFDILNDVDCELHSTMKAIGKEEAPAVVRLHKIICSTIHYIMKNKGLSVLMLSEITEQKNPESKSRVRAIFSGQRKIVEDLARESIDNGELKAGTDPESFSLLYMGIPVGIHIDLILGKTDFDEPAFCERITKSFMQYFTQTSEDMIKKLNHSI